MSYNYSYKSSNTGGSGLPRTGLSNDAEFQAAKMQAMMGGSTMPVHHGVGTSLGMDAEMSRMKREMDSSLRPSLPDSGSSSYSYSTKSSTSGGAAPRTIVTHHEPLSTGGSSVKKVVTTTTTKSNPHAERELTALERDFSRIGRTPDDYHDDFEKIRRDIHTGQAYQGGTVSHQPVAMKVREEHTRGVPARSGHTETKTTTTTRSFGGGAPSSEETTVKTTSSGGRSRKST